MELYTEKYKEYLKKNKTLIEAIIINFLFLVVFLFIFEPTPKQDDYAHSMVLYGGFTNEYSAYAQYTNFLFSKLVQILMIMFPKVSWYYVVQYIFIFISLTMIAYIFIKKGENNEWIIPLFNVLAFCSYELYIRFTFTKVAGITILSGFLVLLYLIENQEKITTKYLVGIVLILMGMVIRGAMYKLMAEVFFSAFIIYFMINRKKHRKNFLFKLFVFIMIVSSMYCCNKGLDLINVKIKSQDEAWSTFLKANGSRAALQDYGMPQYNKYAREYSSIGVSENDYNAWKKEGIYNDYDYFTPELLQKIKQIEPTRKNKKIWEIVRDAFKGALNYYLTNTGIYIFFSAVFFLILFKRNNWLLFLLPIGGCCFFAYIYMYYLGRLQHYVDVSVLVAGTIILFYYCLPIQNVKRQDMIQYYLTVGILTIMFVTVEYEGLVHSSYYGASYGSGKSQREEYEKNKKNLKLFSEDSDHLYLIGAFSTNYIYNREWTAFDVVTPGFYHNMLSSGYYYLPQVDEIISNYGIKNIYQQITNNDRIYAVSVDEGSSFIDTLCTYIDEHYCKGVYYTKVKEIDNINVYRITSGNIKPTWGKKVLKDSFDVISDISVTESSDNIYTVSGYAYVKGVDSYAQNIYIAAEDKTTGKTEYAYTLQTENDLFLSEDKYHGRYSSFCGTIPYFEGVENLQIKVFIETEESVYCLLI